MTEKTRNDIINKRIFYRTTCQACKAGLYENCVLVALLCEVIHVGSGMGMFAVVGYRGVVMLIEGLTDIVKVINRRKKYTGAAGRLYVLTVLPMILLLAGCGAEEEPEDLIVMEQEEEATIYNLAMVAYGDVYSTETVRCKYEQIVEQEISFAVSGKLVSQVHVSVGDQVKKGQILAELGNGGLSDRIEELEYQIARNKQLLEYSSLNENNEISALWLQYIFRSGQSEGELDTLHAAVERVQTRYRHEREDYQDKIDLDTMELEVLRQEAATSVVTSQVDGTVKWIASNLKGSTSVQGNVIMRVVDGSECLFVVSDTSQAYLFSEGTPVEVKISVGTARGEYQLIPYHMEEWEEQERLLFTFVEGDASNIEMGTTGSITVVIEERENVLNVPKRAVHTADGRTFVYCLGKDNIREVRWVETGIYGDGSVEIISGLSEGESIII